MKHKIKIISISIIALLYFDLIVAQDIRDEEHWRSNLEKILGIEDRAGGIHDASNIGLYFENRGKLYPRWESWGPIGEFPINSGKHYIWRINPMVGVPGNVIQGRFRSNEEWEAVGGFHNRDSAHIAFSDKPYSWHPELGWPVKDAFGNDIILSDQDSYCVYNDSGNTKEILGVQIAQTGYAFGFSLVKDMIFFKYEITNYGPNNLTDLYFNLYTNIVVGNVTGGVPEYADDKIEFIKEKNLIYYFDDGYTPEWPDGKTGFFGVVFLKTPKVNGEELGVTDMHYYLFDDYKDIDTLQYGIMSSDPKLYNSSIGYKYFHLGNNPTLNYDDPGTIPPEGLDIVTDVASGPYILTRLDTLTFITAIVAGETEEDIINAAIQAQNIVNINFNVPRPPDKPSLSGIPGDTKVILYWDDFAEYSQDAFSGNYDFEGYRLYKSIDKGIQWDLIADFDLLNSIGDNRGLQYSLIDTNVINGFDYWYSITSYDRGDSTISSLESAIGNTVAAKNTVSIYPRSEAIGREPVSGIEIKNVGTGKSNYILNIDPIDDDNLAGNSYCSYFEFLSKIEIGDLETEIMITVTDSAQTNPHKYGISFTSSNTFDIINFTKDETWTNFNYPPGGREVNFPGHGFKVSLYDQPGTPPNLLPEKGDLISINFTLSTIKNNTDTVISTRPFSINQQQATSDGIMFSLTKPNIISSVSRIGGTDVFNINFSVDDESSVKNNLYIISVDASGILSDGTPYIILSVTDTQIQEDTLHNRDTFSFDGIIGKIEFPSNNPPSAGNKYCLETIKPLEPDIRDIYTFKIQGSSINESKIARDINQIRVVPNPYVVASLYEPEFGALNLEPIRQIHFVNLPPECTIYIFTLDADLIKTIYHNSQSGTEVWDLRTEGGREVASGMYIYVVKSGDAEHRDLIAIIK